MHRVVQRVARPVEHFLRTEAAGGIVLLLATLVALGWANSPFRESYHELWHSPVGVRCGGFEFVHPLHFWVNDVLMTLFFFVVGLEIRREVARGELSDIQRASLPLAAALGGMIVPAIVYSVINTERPTASGWAIPMATDIAFAVGILTLLGKRVPPALRVLLLALAVIDDVGAILVIGLFYSSSFEPLGLAIAAIGILGIMTMQRAGVRRAWLYVGPGLVVWYGIHAAGIHATLAGVIIGLLTPVQAWFGRSAFVRVVGHVVEVVSRERETPNLASEASHLDAEHLDILEEARRELVAPVDYLQHTLHRWVAYVIMPLFAFANAGVSLSSVSLDSASVPLLAGVILGLTIGKPLGITLGIAVLVKTGAAALPRGVTWRGVLVVGLVGGIGFTMSLFIAELSFEGTNLDAAKFAILVGSALAALAGVSFGRVVLPADGLIAGAAQTDSEAEASTAL
jgi:NhaA family Na+:H+ antiporter